MLSERIEQRVLGALRLVDRVTGVAVPRPLCVEADGASLVRNARGYYVVTEVDGLEAHTASFARPPDAPPLGSMSLAFTVRDPAHRYLPRVAAMSVPRHPDPAEAGSEGSLFRPVDVAMYPAPTATVWHNWSALRVSVVRGADLDTALPTRGALIQVIDEADDGVLGSGISDERGEALVVVAGVPVTNFADDDRGGRGGRVVVNALPVRVEVSEHGAGAWPVNPDVLESNHAANLRVTTSLSLSTGRMERVVINLA